MPARVSHSMGQHSPLPLCWLHWPDSKLRVVHLWNELRILQLVGLRSRLTSNNWSRLCCLVHAENLEQSTSCRPLCGASRLLHTVVYDLHQSSQSSLRGSLVEQPSDDQSCAVGGSDNSTFRMVPNGCSSTHRDTSCGHGSEQFEPS